MNPTLPTLLAQIAERAEKATPGPWTKVSSLPTYAIANGYGTDVVTATGREYRQWHPGRHGCVVDDAEFIAHARHDVPRLLKALEKCIGQRERIRLAYLKVHPVPGVIPIEEERAQEAVYDDAELAKILSAEGGE